MLRSWLPATPPTSLIREYWGRGTRWGTSQVPQPTCFWQLGNLTSGQRDHDLQQNNHFFFRWELCRWPGSTTSGRGAAEAFMFMDMRIRCLGIFHENTFIFIQKKIRSTEAKHRLSQLIVFFPGSLAWRLLPAHLLLGMSSDVNQTIFRSSNYLVTKLFGDKNLLF